MLTLSDAQARTIGAVLAGAYYTPAVVEEVEAVLGRLQIDWFTLRDDSPGAGKTIAELEIRRRTRMTVAAILRDVRVKPAMAIPDRGPGSRGRSGLDGRSLRTHPGCTAKSCATARGGQAELLRRD